MAIKGAKPKDIRKTYSIVGMRVFSDKKGSTFYAHCNLLLKTPNNALLRHNITVFTKHKTGSLGQFYNLFTEFMGAPPTDVKFKGLSAEALVRELASRVIEKNGGFKAILVVEKDEKNVKRSVFKSIEAVDLGDNHPGAIAWPASTGNRTTKGEDLFGVESDDEEDFSSFDPDNFNEDT